MTPELPAAITPRTAARLLAQHGLAPRKGAGQNFVVDPNTVERIVAAAGIEPADVVLEIGPGLGSLTFPLARQARRVVAVEIDTGLGALVADLTAPFGNVEVVIADALRTDLDALLGESGRLVANLPYNVATPLLFTALDSSFVVDAYVMVQREVGQRWAARPGDPLHAGVSVKLALLADAVVTLTIPRSVFHPVPNVDSVMVRLIRRPDAPTGQERDRLLRFVDVAFAQRRKTLRNNLRAVAPLEVVAAAADEAGVDLAARAETLDADAILRLVDALASRGVHG